ncbi:hypothetical protein [Micromonospora endolithica]|nr:hypothetical protein [Micromonospora endolithica]
MKIDDGVEPLVRSALDAAVNRDAGRFEDALAAFSDRAQLQAGVELAAAVAAFVLFEIHDGVPSAADAEALAQDIADQESWIGLRQGETASFLAALTERRPLSAALGREGAVVLPFIVAANLLATSASPESGEWWFNYLDKVEAAIEAAG